jgi:hypothetical protein
MTTVNPFAADPDRSGAWDQGYEAGFAEPETDHLPPLEAELLEVFEAGERTGRDDRRGEAATQGSLPSSPSAEFSRFEAAPDGTLIPIPDEGPPGNKIRDDAQITISPRNALGYYYVAIINMPAEAGDGVSHLVTELMTEAAIAELEHILARAAMAGAKGLVKFGGLFVSVAISVFTSSPIAKESRFRAYLPDLTPVYYVIVDPQH